MKSAGYFKAVRRKIAKKAKKPKIKLGNHENFDIIVELEGLAAQQSV